MKQAYQLLLAALLGLASAPAAVAQYEFKDAAGAGTNGLGPYSQNFDLPTAATAVGFNADGSSKNYPGVYARFSVDGDPANGEYVAGFNYTATPSPIPANDGATTNTAWYHFGAVGSTERALGGIGGAVVTSQATYPSGVGFIGTRLKNSSTATIKNLEIRYAMEQWYNSSILQAANVKVHYQRTVRSGTGPYTYTPASLTTLRSGTWTEIPDLKVDAPSTTTPIEERNGNSATNRRVVQTTLAGINLLPGEEIMIRFSYVFNAGSNGNGLSVDDVVITPETNVFYSALTGDLDNLNTWNTATDASGTKPANFTAANQIFYVRGTNGTTTRVQQGNGWAISGTNSKVIVGIPSSPAIGGTAAKAAVPAALFIDAGNKTIVAPIDVADGSTLRIDKVGTALTLGYLAPTSTVEYNNATGSTHTLIDADYGNLTLSGAGAKALGSSLVVSGNLNLSSASKLTLGNFDLTLLRPATNVSTYAGSVLNASSAAYIVTSGTGQLRQSVPNSNTNIVFPVGTAASYTPVKLKQSASTSEDVYGVRVLDDTYLQYSAAGVGSGAAVAFQNVKKTWLIEEEVDGSSNITMTLQWNKADATTDFVAANAHINHFRNGGWDRYTSTVAPTTVATDVYAVQRDGITSFSPFAISSRGNGVLPVELTAFSAQRLAQAVQCTWTTASETNNAQFVVERSLNAEHFEPIGSVQGHGTSGQAHSYTFNDRQPAAGTAYYRLRQQDEDGKESLSPVVVVAGCSDCVTAAGFSIVPNPGAGRFELLTSFAANTTLRATVLNVLGAPVMTRELAVEAGAQHVALDLTSQPAGVYIVRVATPAGPVSLRVVKQ